MRSTSTFVALTAVVLACAGCGGSTKKATSTVPKRIIKGPLPAKSVMYGLNLTDAREHRKGGSGFAVITVNASSLQLCWRFSDLKNVDKPTSAEVDGNLSFGHATTPLGNRFAASGCQDVPPLILRLMETRRHSFRVAIHGTNNPGFPMLQARL